MHAVVVIAMGDARCMPCRACWNNFARINILVSVLCEECPGDRPLRRRRHRATCSTFESIASEPHSSHRMRRHRWHTNQDPCMQDAMAKVHATTATAGIGAQQWLQVVLFANDSHLAGCTQPLLFAAAGRGEPPNAKNITHRIAAARAPLAMRCFRRNSGRLSAHCSSILRRRRPSVRHRDCNRPRRSGSISKKNDSLILTV